jgi:hypothetical protein
MGRKLKFFLMLSFQNADDYKAAAQPCLIQPGYDGNRQKRIFKRSESCYNKQLYDEKREGRR